MSKERKKMSNDNKGKLSTKTNKQMSISKIGSKNPMWKGAKVRCAVLHDWVRARIKKPDVCELCHYRKPIDLANISGRYLRDLKD